MTDLIDTTEMYLRTILELEEEGITPMRARIAERLDHSGPTVSQTVARMEKHGLLTVEPDRHLELTDEGRKKAVEVMRKHRLAERLLSDVIGLDIEYVHDEACRWEHVMSDHVEKRTMNVPFLWRLLPAIPALRIASRFHASPNLFRRILTCSRCLPTPVLTLVLRCLWSAATITM